MRLIVDANIFIIVHGFTAWTEIASALERYDSTLITLDTVYRRECPDAVRRELDRLEESDRLEVIHDPDRERQPTKRGRKLRKRILREARRARTTSDVDQQLLWVAMRSERPLLTDERPLQQLAERLDFRDVYDALDVIDGLYEGGAIDASRRRDLLESRPGGRDRTREELEDTLARRDGGLCACTSDG